MTTIHVLSWNLHSQRYSPYQWSERFPIIVSTIEKSDPDIICLQEVEPDQMKKDLITHFSFNKSYYAHYTPKADNADGILVLQRLNPDPTQIDFKMIPDTNQVASILSLTPLTVVTVHLKSKSRNHEIRETQITNLLNRHQSPPQSQTIIIGDFNEDPQDDNNQKVYQILKSHDYHHAYPLDSKTTHKIDSEGTYVHRKIDWIWAPSHCQLTPTSTIDQSVQLPNLELNHPSDHHPISAKLTYQPIQ